MVDKKEVRLPSDAKYDNEATTPSAFLMRDLVERVIFYVGVPAVTLYRVGALFYCLQFVTHYDKLYRILDTNFHEKALLRTHPF